MYHLVSILQLKRVTQWGITRSRFTSSEKRVLKFKVLRPGRWRRSKKSTALELLKPHHSTIVSRPARSKLGCYFCSWVVFAPPELSVYFSGRVLRLSTCRTAWRVLNCSNEVRRHKFEGKYYEVYGTSRLLLFGRCLVLSYPWKLGNLLSILTLYVRKGKVSSRFILIFVFRLNSPQRLHHAMTV